MTEKWAEIKKLHQVMKLEDGYRMTELTVRMNGDAETLGEIIDFIDHKVSSLNQKETDVSPYEKY